MATSPLRSRGPTNGRNCDLIPAVSGVPDKRDKMKIAYLTTTFSGAHKWAELLPDPCLLGGPQQTGQNQNWLPHPCLLGPRKTLHSWGPTNGRNCYVTPAFSGVPNKGDKIRSGSHKPAFSGAHKWAELLCKPCILGVPLHSRGSPTKGTISKVATSLLPARGPTSGRNSDITPAFLGVPNKGDKSKVAALGARTKLSMCSPKEYHQILFAQMACLHRKTPLNPSHGPF